MRSTVLACSAILAFAVGSFGSAQAATITQNISVGAFSTTSYSVPITVNAFDPSLGTLTSVTATLTGSYTSDTGAGYTEATSVLLAPSGNSLYLVSANTPNDFGGIISLSGSGTSTNSFALASLTGLGTKQLVYAFSDMGIPESDSSSGLTGTLVYTYTPAAPSPIPEPSSLMLLGTGVIGAAEAMRRRLPA